MHHLSSHKFNEYIFSDTDVFWNHNPINDLRKNCKKKICFQSDSLNRYVSINSGFYYTPNTSYVQDFFSDALLLAKNNKYVKSGDQKILNELLKTAKYRTLAGFLNIKLYPHGGIPNIWKNISSLRQNILILHNNYIVGLKQKIQRQKIYNIWSLDDNFCCLNLTQVPKKINKVVYL